MQSGNSAAHLSAPVRGRLRQTGFSFVWALAAVALFGLGLALIAPPIAQQIQREREQDLLRIGRLYAEAIAQYHKVSPGSLKQYPPNLESLLEDTRFIGTVRHLRKLYSDPLQPDRPLAVVRGADGTVRGVFSNSPKQPLRTGAVDLGVVILPPAKHYFDWQFVPSQNL